MQAWGGPAAPVPYKWLTLDVETVDGRPEDAERLMRVQWAPNPDWKPETIGNRYLAALAKKKEKLALIDEAPLACVAIRSDSELRCLHAMYAHEPRLKHGGLIQGFSDRREMLVAFRTLLETRLGPDAPLVGHNILHFDLRKIRWQFLKEGLRLPRQLVTREQPVFDMMVEYGRRFSTNGGDIMVGLADVLEAFGLPTHKGIADGADVPQLYRQGEFDLIVEYCMLDVIAEADLFVRMNGGVNDEERPANPLPRPKALAPTPATATTAANGGAS